MLVRAILIAGAILALFLLVLVANKQPRNRADRYLLIWLLLIGLDLFYFYDSSAIVPAAPIPLQVVGFFLPLLHAPAMFAYIHQLTSGAAIKRSAILLHTFPYLLGVAGLLYYYLDPFNVLTFHWGFIGLAGPDPLYFRSLAGTSLALSGAGYPIAGLILILRYQQRLPQLHANPSLISLNWLRYLATATVLFFCLVFVIIRFGPETALVSIENVFLLVGIFTTVHVFALGYFGLRQRVLLPAETEVVVTPPTGKLEPAYANTGLSAKDAGALYAGLIDYMTKHQPYLDADLNLPYLAQSLDCTPNQLSQVINQLAGTNFFTFVNNYRIEEVKHSMANPSLAHYTILALAYDAGFGSKATFNKVFKEATGVLPSAFRRKALQKKS